MCILLKKTSLITLGILIYLFSFISQAEVNNSKSGFIDFNIYPYLSDVDNDNTFTINIFSKLENRFSYFSLTNIGNQKGQSELEDTTTFYTEQNVRWQIQKNSPFDLTLQMNFRTGENNDRHRLGIRWRLNHTGSIANFFKRIHLNYSINWHAIQFDKEQGNVWQLEHVFQLKLPYLSKDLYLVGFIDHTFNQNLSNEFPENPIVAEVQLGYKIIENLFFIGEYRVNEYRRSNINNFAAGFEYKIRW